MGQPSDIESGSEGDGALTPSSGYLNTPHANEEGINRGTHAVEVPLGQPSDTPSPSPAKGTLPPTVQDQSGQPSDRSPPSPSTPTYKVNTPKSVNTKAIFFHRKFGISCE